VTSKEIIRYRLYHQQISHQIFQNPGDVVSWMGAMQAQDYTGAKWSVGLRLPHATDAEIEEAIVKKLIVRTWPMRGTLHFVAAADIRWILKLLTPRIIAGSAGRHRQLELDEKVFTRSKKLFIRALQDGKQLTRNDMYSLLENAGIATKGQRGIHILWRTAQEGLICFASHQGKQPSFALLDEWVPAGQNLSHDESLATLALRYFTSHGPATLQDFTWWSGLKTADARAGISMAGSKLIRENVKGTDYWMSSAVPSLSRTASEVFLLPGFDEYMLGYKDRSVILDPLHAQKVVPGNNGMFAPTIVSKGEIKGTWKRVFKNSHIAMTIQPFLPLSKTDQQAVERQARHYGKFMELPVSVQKNNPAVHKQK
jgi:hypothetical protein